MKEKQYVKKITDKQFKEAASVLLPEYIQAGNRPYMLNAYQLMSGGYCLSYYGPYLESDTRTIFHQIWDDPMDCIKIVYHDVVESLGIYEIDIVEFDRMNGEIRKDKGIVDKHDKIVDKGDGD